MTNQITQRLKYAGQPREIRIRMPYVYKVRYVLNTLELKGGRDLEGARRKDLEEGRERAGTLERGKELEGSQREGRWELERGS